MSVNMRISGIAFAITLAISVSCTRSVYANVEVSLEELMHESAVQMGRTIKIYVQASGGTPPYRFSKGWTIDLQNNSRAYREFRSETVASKTPSDCTVYDMNHRNATISFSPLYWIDVAAVIDKSPNKVAVQSEVISSTLSFEIPRDVTIAVPPSSGLQAALEITLGDKTFSKSLYDPVTVAHPVRATSSTMPTANSAFIGDKELIVNVYDNTGAQIGLESVTLSVFYQPNDAVINNGCVDCQQNVKHWFYYFQTDPSVAKDVEYTHFYWDTHRPQWAAYFSDGKIYLSDFALTFVPLENNFTDLRNKYRDVKITTGANGVLDTDEDPDDVLLNNIAGKGKGYPRVMCIRKASGTNTLYSTKSKGDEYVYDEYGNKVGINTGLDGVRESECDSKDELVEYNNGPGHVPYTIAVNEGYRYADAIGPGSDGYLDSYDNSDGAVLMSSLDSLNNPNPNVTINWSAKGAKYIAKIIIHEEKHQEFYNDTPTLATDPDEDGVITSKENSDPYYTHPKRKDSYGMGSHTSSDRKDNEFYAYKTCADTAAVYDDTKDRMKDGANY